MKKPLRPDMSLPDTYSTLLKLSQNMLELAQLQDWDALAQTEKQRASIIAALPTIPPTLSVAACNEITSCIKKIQACDQEIDDYVTPWREQVATLLARLNATP